MFKRNKELGEAHFTAKDATRKVFEIEKAATADDDDDEDEDGDDDDDDEKETLLSLDGQPQKEEQPRTWKWRNFVSWTWINRRCCRFLVGSIVILLVIGVPRTHRGSSKEVHSLNINDIHQWCLEPDDTDCVCPSPLLLSPPQPLSPDWTKMHKHNVQTAESAAERLVDVAFLGDSITEGWSGTAFGNVREDRQANLPVFQSFFDPSKGGDFTGVVLGIAGDTSPNLAWRLENGEAPPNLRPRVWWILIGTNDFRSRCSEEVVLMGIRRVLWEFKLRTAKEGKNVRVVVNSLLPRSDDNQDRRLTAKRLYDDGGRTLWNAIQKVNQELERLCDETPGWEFFNATDIFVRQLESPPEKEVESPYYIPEELMADQLHPTSEGYNLWGTEIVKRLHSLLDE